MATITADTGGGDWHTGATWIGGVAPGISDTAVLDASSGNVTVVDGQTNRCAVLDASAYTGTLTINGRLQIAVSANPGALRILDLSAGMTLASSATGFFSLNRSANGTKKIFTSGKTLPRVSGVKLQLEDDVICNGTQFVSSQGFESAGFNVTVTGTLSLAGVGTIALGSSQLTCYEFVGAPTDGGTSTLTINGNAGVSTNITAGGSFYNIVLAAGVSHAFQNGAVATTLNGLTVSGSGATTITFSAESTYTIPSSGNWPSGSDGNVVTMQSDSAGTSWNLVCTSGTVSVDYVSLKDSAASGGATFEPGEHSTNVSGNSGWNFPAAAGGQGLVKRFGGVPYAHSLGRGVW